MLDEVQKISDASPLAIWTGSEWLWGESIIDCQNRSKVRIVKIKRKFLISIV